MSRGYTAVYKAHLNDKGANVTLCRRCAGVLANKAYRVEYEFRSDALYVPYPSLPVTVQGTSMTPNSSYQQP